MELLRQEAEILKSLNHENVVQFKHVTLLYSHTGSRDKRTHFPRPRVHARRLTL